MAYLNTIYNRHNSPEPDITGTRTLEPLRATVSVAGFGVLVAALWWGTAEPVAAATTGTATFDELAAALAALGAWALLGWLFLVALVTVLSTVPGRTGRWAVRCAERMAPVAARHLVRAAVGVATAAVPLTGAAAYGAGPAPAAPASLSSAAHSDVDLESLPEIGRPQVAVPVLESPRAVDGGSANDHPPDDPPPPFGEDRTGEGSTGQGGDSLDAGGTVTVQHGDTLWSIAADHLGPAASPADIAAEWPRWYTANQDAIGPDPDVIHPGTRLHMPKP